MIPDSVTSIGRIAFYECSNLKEVSLRTLKSIGDDAFYGCTALTKVIIRAKKEDVNK